MIKALTKTQRARLLRLTKPMMLEEIVKLVDMLRDTHSRDEVECLKQENEQLEKRLEQKTAECLDFARRMRSAEEESRRMYQAESELNSNLRRERLIVNKLVGL